MIGILAEKPSAMRNMAKALGGTTGTYNGEQYVLVAARGHLYALDDPEKQVSADLTTKYKSWDISNLPWNEADLKWKYKKGKDVDDTLKTIKSVLSSCDEVCIATDDDPTGEGSLLAWEILDQLKISPKKWSRMYFADESVKSLQKSFTGRKSLISMEKDPDYVKAFYRGRWDFMSMQFTRIATKNGDGQAVLRQGRLKSAMVLLVGDALKAVSEYKKIPYYQNRFKDENGVVYTNPDEPNFPNKDDVPNTYHTSDVVFDGAQMKSTAPPKLLDLASLSARLVTKGYTAKQVTTTYQKMYEAQVVSYPRTEDKQITPEQFDELLPLIDNIARVVSVDPALLTHRIPRSTHVKTGGAHGANRPGPNVPKSLADLSKFDSPNSVGLAADIYTMLGQNYLATVAEDYEYESQKGHVKEYPDFKGTASIPKKMGWKLVFNADADPDPDENTAGIGKVADPFVFEGFPPKPPTPTMKWLMAQLEKRDVGTGATRTSTYSEVTNSSATYPLMIDKKGKITLTEYGEMSYRILPGTNIGSLDMTERLMQEMRDIAAGKKDPEACLHDIQRMVKEDILTMQKNGENMRAELGVTMNASKVSTAERYECDWKGKKAAFKREWSGYRFSDAECETLANGGEIEFEAVSAKTGKPFKVKGSLEVQTYKGKKFLGIKTEFVNDGTADKADAPDRHKGTWNGKSISFKKEWGGHTFTDEECEKLCNGETIEIEAISNKTKKPYKCVGKLEEQVYNGNKFVGFKADFDSATKPSSGSTSAPAGAASNKPRVPDVWCEHAFTDEEKALLETGMTVECSDFIGKSGKFTAKVHFGKKDDGRMGIVPEFSNKRRG